MESQVGGTPLMRALALKCPRCGRGDLFRNWFMMHRHCSGCGLKFEREPGYFLGSIYVNYGITTLSVIALFVLLRFHWELEPVIVTPICLAWCIGLPILLFRYARAYWLAMDSLFDKTDFAEAPGLPGSNPVDPLQTSDATSYSPDISPSEPEATPPR